MFCTNCGNQCSEDAVFCPNCGNTLNSTANVTPPTAPPVNPDPPYTPYTETPVTSTPKRSRVAVAPVTPATPRQKKAAVILALIAVFALVIGCANIFCMHELPVSVNADAEITSIYASSMRGFDIDDLDDYEDMMEGLSSRARLPEEIPEDVSGTVVVADVSIGILSDASDVLDYASGGQYSLGMTAGYIGLIFFGLINLGIAAIGALYYLHIRTGKFAFFGFLKGRSPLTLVGIVGAIAALAQILLMLTTGISEEAPMISVSVSIGVHWTTWLSLGIYAALAGYELLRLDKSEN